MRVGTCVSNDNILRPDSASKCLHEILISESQLVQWANAAGLRDPAIVITDVADQGQAIPRPIAQLAPDRPLYPASMIKTPIAAALTHLWSTGELQAGDQAEVGVANMTANDLASPLIPGYRASLDELANLMLTRSDNVATNMLIDTIGRGRITTIAARLGLPRTAVRRKLSGSHPLIEDPEATGRNAHPADEAARLFGAIATASIPGATWLYEMLLAQRWNDKLSPGLRASDRFAHKTGETSEVSHDGGILITADGRRYVVVVYTALPAVPENTDRIGAFMRALRPHL